MKYLMTDQLKTNLSLGRTVEQWIGHERKTNYTVLQWLIIEKENNGEYSVVFKECFDEGAENFLDIYEFSALDPDEPYGMITTFGTIADAIEFSESEYGASKDKFVNSEMIQEEYLAYLKGQK